MEPDKMIKPAYIGGQFSTAYICGHKTHLMVEKAAEFAVYIACNDLGLDLERDNIEFIKHYSALPVMADTLFCRAVKDEHSYIITIYPNMIIRDSRKLNFNDFIFNVIKTMFHELRHVYQYINNMCGINDPHDDLINNTNNYIKNWNNYEFEQDADNYADDLADRNIELIYNFIISIVNEAIMYDSTILNVFDINNFINFSEKNNIRVFNDILKMYGIDDKNIKTIPVYRNHDTDINTINIGDDGTIYVYYVPFKGKYNNYLYIPNINTRDIAHDVILDMLEIALSVQRYIYDEDNSKYDIMNNSITSYLTDIIHPFIAIYISSNLY